MKHTCIHIHGVCGVLLCSHSANFGCRKFGSVVTIVHYWIYSLSHANELNTARQGVLKVIECLEVETHNTTNVFLFH